MSDQSDSFTDHAIESCNAGKQTPHAIFKGLSMSVSNLKLWLHLFHMEQWIREYMECSKMTKEKNEFNELVGKFIALMKASKSNSPDDLDGVLFSNTDVNRLYGYVNRMYQLYERQKAYFIIKLGEQAESRKIDFVNAVLDGISINNENKGVKS